jgi:HAD superfamily hydrolase (TIGR01549 family)
MMIKAVFFDLDGTLVEFKLDVHGSKIKVVKVIKSILPDIEGLDGSGSYHMMLDRVRESTEKAVYEKVREQVYSILNSFEEDAARKTELRPDVIEVLNELRNSGKKLALLTNSGRKAVNFVLNRFQITDFFDIILTRDDVKFMKPSPVGVRYLLDSFKLKPWECVTVGDGIIDIKPSQIVGVKTIVILGGFTSIEKLRNEGPDHIVYNLADIIPLIGQL